MSLLEIATNALTGGAVGAVGAAVSRWQQGKVELDTLKVQVAHELALANIELEQSKLAQAVTLDKAASELQATSYTHDGGMGYAQHTGVMLFVDAVRGIVRPVLTAGLVGTTAALGLTIAHSAVLPPEHQAAILQQIVDGLISCTGLALAWWFGARNIK